MNILIAGIISVIMLLFGGAGYYNYHHRNQPEPETPLTYNRDPEFNQEYEDALNHIARLPQTHRNGRYYRVIRTEEELMPILEYALRSLPTCVLYVSPTLTEERILSLFQDNLTGTMQYLIPEYRRNIIPEGDHD
jgi:hypothetical protein